MKTHGTIHLERARGAWKIETQPHVILRLKRVFPKIARHNHGAIRISDTDENARELLWFLERYPMEVDPRDHLELRARAHRDRETAVEALLSGVHVAPEFDLALPPREYQKIAAAIVLAGGSLLLADDVGLGKTVSAIATFADRRTLPALVVTLAHLPRQWEAEIKRFAPKLRTHILKKGTPYDLRRKPTKEEIEAANRVRASGPPKVMPEPAMPDVIIATYHKLDGWAETLGKLVKSVVFDECQELRHEKHGKKPSAKYSAAKHIADQAPFRMGLSATPIYNYGGEIFNIMNVIRPGALGTKAEFVTEWCGGDGDDGGSKQPQIKDPKAFGTYAREAGLMLRRTRQDVGRELPALTRVPHPIDADLDALNRVESSAAELARIVLEQKDAFRGQTMQASSELSNVLRQATGIAKAPYVADFVRLLVESGERVVLYGWHREVYSLWLERLKDLEPVLYTGSESAVQKQASKDAFVSGKSKVLIISLRAGAGLDGLQHVSRTVVFGELDWSPGVHEQCIGRVYRDGQQEPVVAYFLLAESGVDPIIADVLQIKREQSDGIRDPGADELVEQLQVAPGQVRKLAEAFLRERGLPIPEPAKEQAS